MHPHGLIYFFGEYPTEIVRKIVPPGHSVLLNIVCKTMRVIFLNVKPHASITGNVVRGSYFAPGRLPPFIHWCHLSALRLENANFNTAILALEFSLVLQSLSFLKDLHLSNNSMTDDFIQVWCASLQNCTELATLDLSFNEIKERGAGLLARIMPKIPQLKRFNIGSNNISDLGLEELSDGFALCHALSNIDISRNAISSGDVVAGCMVATPQLSHMNISMNGDIFVNGSDKIIKALQRCRNLTRLELSGVQLHFRNTVQQLAVVLAGCGSLEYLSVSDNNLQDLEFEEISKALPSCPKLHTFNISHNQTMHDGVSKLCGELPNCVSLTDLDLSFISRNDSIHHDIMHKIVHFLSKCVLLRKLSLAQNNLGIRGIGILAERLSFFSALQALDLSGNGVTNGALQRLSTFLPKCRNLLALSLSENMIGDGELSSLTSVLPHCHYLQRLYLDNNHISDDGMQIISDVICKCVSLVHIDLSNNFMGGRGMGHIARKLPFCSSLQVLNISHCPWVRFQDIQELAAISLPSLNIISSRNRESSCIV